MDLFFDHARQLYQTALASGAESHTTIVVGRDGSLHFLADSDWPLDRLLEHHGGRAVYRVRSGAGEVAVEGRSRRESCRLEAAAIPRPRRAGISPIPRAAWD